MANINRIVGEDDELWILGDIGYRTSVRHLKSCLRQLRCRHLHAVIGNHDDWWLDDAPARDLFESIEPNSTAELTGLGIAARRRRRPSTYRISPTVRILPMAGRMMPYVSAIRHCRSTDIVCCMATRTSCLRRAHATKPQRWTGRMESATGKRNTDCRLVPCTRDRFNARITAGYARLPGPAPIDSAAQQEPGGSVSAAES